MFIPFTVSPDEDLGLADEVEEDDGGKSIQFVIDLRFLLILFDRFSIEDTSILHCTVF